MTGAEYITRSNRVLMVLENPKKLKKRKKIIFLFFLIHRRLSVYNYIYFIFLIYVTVSPISNTMLKLHNT